MNSQIQDLRSQVSDLKSQISDFRSPITAAARLALLIAAAWSIAPAPARAQSPVGNPFGARQVPGPFGRPIVSPYINLLRTNSPVLDYYGIVRPEIEFHQTNTRIETSIQRLDTQFQSQLRQQTANSLLTPTGRPSAFMTDLRGRPETLVQDMRSRQLLLEVEMARTGRTVAPSGHTVVFGNRGYFYRQGLAP